MIIRIFDKHEVYLRRFELWESWFAWHPIFIDGEMIWLERIERKLESSYARGIFWAYRIQTHGIEEWDDRAGE